MLNIALGLGQERHSREGPWSHPGWALLVRYSEHVSAQATLHSTPSGADKQGDCTLTVSRGWPMMTLAAPGDGRNTAGHLVPALDRHRGSGIFVVTATFQNTHESQGSNPIPTHKN